jgi:hypothetical protein
MTKAWLRLFIVAKSSFRASSVRAGWLLANQIGFNFRSPLLLRLRARKWLPFVRLRINHDTVVRTGFKSNFLFS